MNANDNRRQRRRRLAVGAAAVVGISLAAASPAAADSGPGKGWSGAGTASVAHDTLTVRGTNGNDQVALRLAPGNPGVLQVDFGDDGSADFSFNRDTFSKIKVLLRNGNDRFRIDQVNGAFADEQVTVNGGKGNDNLHGGDGADIFIGGSGRDTVDGNRGNDEAHLGPGDDTFTWDPGDGSDTIDGGRGTDTLDFNGADVAEKMSLSPNGASSQFTRDVGNITMDMDRVERLDLTALKGADEVTINDMSGTGFRRADVDLSAAGNDGAGDGMADKVTVNGTRNADDIEVTAQGTRVDVEGLRPTTRITGSDPFDPTTNTGDLLQINAGVDDKVNVDGAVLALIGVDLRPDA